MDNDEEKLQGLQEDDLLEESEVDTMMRQIISQTVGDKQLDHNSIDQWTTEIIEGCLKRLTAFGKPFKFIVVCNVSQKVLSAGSVCSLSLELQTCLCKPGT